MCIIVDTNVFSSVLDPESSDQNFKPIHDWIFSGNGKMVYGGKKYMEELTQSSKYVKIFNSLSRAGKTIHIVDAEVDDFQSKIEKIITDADFDDPHLIAIVAISGCRLICTKDSRCHKFLKIKEIYPKKSGVPKFYHNPSQRHLISNQSLKTLCRICKSKSN
jgi:hypothetical protein